MHVTSVSSLMFGSFLIEHCHCSTICLR